MAENSEKPDMSTTTIPQKEDLTEAAVSNVQSKKAIQINEAPANRHKEFAAFLEEIGFTNSLTHVVVDLYQQPENSQDPSEYFLNHLTNNFDIRGEIDEVQGEIYHYEQQLSSLLKENEFLRERLAHHEKVPDSILEVEEETEELSDEDIDNDGDEIIEGQNGNISLEENFLAEIQREMSTLMSPSQATANTTSSDNTPENM